MAVRRGGVGCEDGAEPCEDVGSAERPQRIDVIRANERRESILERFTTKVLADPRLASHGFQVRLSLFP
jgi:hypothetical protein